MAACLVFRHSVDWLLGGANPGTAEGAGILILRYEGVVAHLQRPKPSLDWAD
jgi:hypothetical protein